MGTTTSGGTGRLHQATGTRQHNLRHRLGGRRATPLYRQLSHTAVGYSVQALHQRHWCLAVATIAAVLLVAACSDDGDLWDNAARSGDLTRRQAVAYPTARAAFDALNGGGFDCREPEPLSFFYETVGPVDTVACTFDHSNGHSNELLVGVFTTVEPSRELLDDWTDELVVGPNWLVSISDDPAAIVEAIDGQIVTDRSRYPEWPATAGAPRE